MRSGDCRDILNNKRGQLLDGCWVSELVRASGIAGMIVASETSDGLPSVAGGDLMAHLFLLSAAECRG